MTITVPRWAPVLLALLVLGGGGFYGGYRVGDHRATSEAVQREGTLRASVEADAKRDQLGAFRRSLQGNYRYARGWIAPECSYVKRSTRYPYPDGDCPVWPENVTDLSEFTTLITGATKAVCIRVSGALGDSPADGGRCPHS